MKSFHQLAKAAYEAWHASNTPPSKHQVPFEELDTATVNRWITVAQAVATEIAGIH